MKKILSLIMVATMAIGLTACGGTTVSSEEAYLKVMSEEQIERAYQDEEALSYAKAKIGNKMPNITIKDEEGKEIELDSLKGDYILEMMATWCPACESTMPQLEEYKRLNPDKNIYSVAYSESAEDIRAFYDENGYTLPVYTSAMTEDELKSALDLKYIPMFYFVKNGTVQFVRSGEMTVDLLDKIDQGIFGE